MGKQEFVDGGADAKDTVDHDSGKEKSDQHFPKVLSRYNVGGDNG